VSRAGAFTFYEFFAGGGMARAGLGPGWRCLLANDLDPLKARAYRENWGGEHLVVGDVWGLGEGDLPGRADLAWASSPCQDFSLAGARAGLGGLRSSAFLGFWRLIEALDCQGRAPRVVVIENVVGLLSSRGGADFAAVCERLAERGYAFGAVEIDAAALAPQSRPRLFLVGAREHGMAGRGAPGDFHTPAVRRAQERLTPALAARWVWWPMSAPAARNIRLADLLEPDDAVAWRSAEQTEALLAQMNDAHRAKLEAALAGGARIVGTVCRRIRREGGERVQRAELRLDGLAGCLRTPSGGSSRQFVVVAEAGQARSRFLTAREGARLMGLPDHYRLPVSQNAGLKVVGDGVAAPVVRLLAEQVLEPLLAAPAIAAAE
jgi:DNA (cytosine-5)-methyltransferase 1